MPASPGQEMSDREVHHVCGLSWDQGAFCPVKYVIRAPWVYLCFDTLAQENLDPAKEVSVRSSTSSTGGVPVERHETYCT